jgi:hypothetical protein
LTALGATPDQVAFSLAFFFGSLTVGQANGADVNLGGVTLGQILMALLIQSDYLWSRHAGADRHPDFRLGRSTTVSFSMVTEYCTISPRCCQIPPHPRFLRRHRLLVARDVDR